MERPRTKRRRTLASALLAGMAAAAPAVAGDGGIEINDARAQTGGVSTGDLPGYPVTLSEPGSYRLSGNLTVPDENTNAIDVTSPGVSIDLAGFVILGPVQCTTTPVTCTPAGGAGIGIHAPSADDLSVRGGVIVGMGQYGVLATGANPRLEELRVFHSGSSAISARDGATISGCIVSRNGTYGIVALEGAIVRDSVADENRLNGIFVNARSVVTRNVTQKNGTRGVYAVGDGTVVRENVAFDNGTDGIEILGAGLVADNAVLDNTNDGIDCNAGCAVNGNLAVANGNGLNLTADAAYRKNTLVDNVTAPVVGAGVERGNNFCSGAGTIAATCP
jgi:hypothetical protein